MASEDLGSDVVRGADGGVGEHAAGFTPGVDLATVAHCEIDLIQGDRIAVLLLLVDVAFE